MICEYGCGQEAKYQFKNGKWCCSSHWKKCLVSRKKNSIQSKKSHKDPNSKFKSKSCKEKMSNSMKKLWANPNSKLNSFLRKEKQSNTMKEAWRDPNSKLNTISWKEKQSEAKKKLHKDPNSKYKLSKVSINNINKKYPFFSKIEEMRYNNKKEIQVHCKNHECENSKEKDGWFNPTYSQLYERIRQLEKDHGNGGGYFYCSQCCKDSCLLFNIKADPNRDNNNNKSYTPGEFQTFRTFVLERDNYICQFCGKPATDVHHERPQKLEPFFSLDPDYAWSCCEKCHYKKGHKDECSTGNLAKIVCSVESQKFLNQNI